MGGNLRDRDAHANNKVMDIFMNRQRLTCKCGRGQNRSLSNTRNLSRDLNNLVVSNRLVWDPPQVSCLCVKPASCYSIGLFF